jgi:hypothetical protein
MARTDIIPEQIHSLSHEEFSELHDRLIEDHEAQFTPIELGRLFVTIVYFSNIIVGIEPYVPAGDKDNA